MTKPIGKLMTNKSIRTWSDLMRPVLTLPHKLSSTTQLQPVAFWTSPVHFMLCMSSLTAGWVKILASSPWNAMNTMQQQHYRVTSTNVSKHSLMIDRSAILRLSWLDQTMLTGHGTDQTRTILPKSQWTLILSTNQLKANTKGKIAIQRSWTLSLLFLARQAPLSVQRIHTTLAIFSFPINTVGSSSR